MELRPLGNSGIEVTPVALGCWPISGVSSLEVNDADSLATIEACFDAGVNFLDTAYMYGRHGESERLIARAVGSRRDEIVIATKCGMHWDEQNERAADGRPDMLRRECEESLRRLNTDHVELLYLHAPDPATSIAESAAGLKRLMDAGKTRSVGVSNLSVAQMEEFIRECPISVVQPPYNMLQRQIEADLLPWCRERNIATAVYWPLMKGLLAGKLPRDYQFQPGDGRAKYPMFHGEEWEKNQTFLEELRKIATAAGKTVAQVVINWTLQQPGITVCICGAKRPYQIQETAAAMGWRLSDEHVKKIDAALIARGTPAVGSAV